MRKSKLGILVCVTFLLAGCAVKYRPAPIAPAESAAGLEARTLHDAGLRKFISETSGRPLASWPPAQWDLPDLTLGAFYYNPGLQLARGRLAEAEAAITTAGARPNPTVSGTIGGSTSPASPWIGSLGFALPIQTAGKRGYRITRAERLADAARWDLAGAAWKVRAEVRTALVQCLIATRRLQALQAEEHVRAEEVTLLEQRLAVGMIPRPEADAARIQHSQAVLALQRAEGRVAETRAALAAAIGIPASALNNVVIAWPDFDRLPGPESLPPGRIQRDAVLDRLDVRRALAGYAAAEAGLQLQIARQYPDIQLGPGYDFDEGHSRFTLGFSIALPVFNRNQGPIAEAEARRAEAASRFLVTQAAGIARSEQALARYRAALNEVAQARHLQQQLAAQEQATREALRGGESDRVALNGVQLQAAVAAMAQVDALARAQQALGSLEDAVQRPLQPGDIGPLSPQSPALKAPGAK